MGRKAAGVELARGWGDVQPARELEGPRDLICPGPGTWTREQYREHLASMGFPGWVDLDAVAAELGAG